MPNLTDKQQRFVQEYIIDLNAIKAALRADIEISRQVPEDAPYVYILVRDDNKSIVYVGKGRGNRMFSHMKEVVCGKISGVKKYLGLKALYDAKISIIPYVVWTFSCDEAALTVESLMINNLRDTILNTTAGVIPGHKDLEMVNVLKRRLMSRDDFILNSRSKALSGKSVGETYDFFVNQIDKIAADIEAKIMKNSAVH